MRTVIHTPNAPAAVGPYSQAVKTQDLVFTAGQLGLDPGTGQLAGPGVIEQTHQAMCNLKAILEAAGTDVRSIVKTTIFVTDMAGFRDVNETYGAFLKAEGVTEPPARATAEVAALPLQGRVMIEVVAYVAVDTAA